METLHLFLYRVYFVLQRGGLGSLWRRLPLGALKKSVRHLFNRLAPPDRLVLVQVKSGLSKGMSIRIRLPAEAGYWHGGRDRGTQDAISAAVRPEFVVYDIGAHIGAVTLGVARLVGEWGRVVAFDGDPGNAVSLRENCELNDLEKRVQVVNAAVWSYTSDAIVFRQGLRRSHGGVEADGQSPVLGGGPAIRVPSITLDDFLEADGHAPQLIKIDVEGGEYEVLRGGEKLFTNVRPLMVVEVHHHQALDQITTWLRRFQYEAKWEIPEPGFPRILLAWPAEAGSTPFG